MCDKEKQQFWRDFLPFSLFKSLKKNYQKKIIFFTGRTGVHPWGQDAP